MERTSTRMHTSSIINRHPIMNQMKGILIVDHGSTKHQANHMLQSMAELIQTTAGTEVPPPYPHMGLAEPRNPAGIPDRRQSRPHGHRVRPLTLSPCPPSRRSSPH